MVISVVYNHLTNLQPVQNKALHRGANQSLGMSSHKINMLRGAFVSCHNQIALVLAILIVHHHNHIAITNFLNCFFYCCKICHYNRSL